eukprot:9603552-Lingulodinium_polyedra.AAC.1
MSSPLLLNWAPGSTSTSAHLHRCEYSTSLAGDANERGLCSRRRMPPRRPTAAAPGECSYP